MNLLIVETDEQFRRNLSERLRMERYAVTETHLEAEAKRIVRKRNMDVVLLGMKGFKERGLALLKAIKESRPLTEVILLTHSEDLSLSASIEGMKLGAFDDVLIPFDLETLIKRIHEAYGRKKERERARKSALRGYREKSDGPDGSDLGENAKKPETDRRVRDERSRNEKKA